MTPERFSKLLLMSLAVPTLLVFVMASVVAFEVGQLRDALGWVDHTDTVIAETRAELRRIVDAETGLRGFLVTGREEFLESQRESSGTAARFAKLEAMVADNPPQRQRLDEIRGKFENWIGYSKQMVQLREGAGNYSDFELNMTGKRMMDEIRAGFATVIDVEQALRDTRLERATHIDKDFKISLAGLSLLLATTLVLFSRYQLRNLALQYGSALKTAEEKAAEERERKQWFLTLLRSVGDAVIATNANGRITFMNPAAEAATGWSEAAAKQQRLESVFRTVKADTRERLENPVDRVRRLNAVAGPLDHRLLIRRDESEIHVDDCGAPIRDDDGKIIGFILIFRDVTRQYELERTLRTSEKLALAGRITASVAHEIHNPLDTVGNLLHMILIDGGSEHIAEYAELATQQLQRVHQVTLSMLNLYRESHAPVTVKLAEVVNSALALLEMQVRSKEAQVTCRFTEGSSVEGFPGELRQVFTNLIHNALDAIPQGGTIAIDCMSGGTQKQVNITITDNGCGIAEQDIPRLFQPLFTTKGESGTGLGLWVSKGIVEKHGGTIDVETKNTPGESWTRFHVVLPRQFPSLVSTAQALAN